MWVGGVQLGIIFEHAKQWNFEIVLEYFSVLKGKNDDKFFFANLAELNKSRKNMEKYFPDQLWNN